MLLTARVAYSIALKPGFYIVVSEGDAPQSVDRRCYWDAYDDMGTFFGDVADVPLVSPTFQSRWKKLKSVHLLRMPPLHRRHIPIDAWTSPSLTTIWKPGLNCLSANQVIVQLIDSSEMADTLLSKPTGVGFKPVTSWLWTRGKTTALSLHFIRIIVRYYTLYDLMGSSITRT